MNFRISKKSTKEIVKNIVKNNDKQNAKKSRKQTVFSILTFALLFQLLGAQVFLIHSGHSQVNPFYLPAIESTPSSLTSTESQSYRTIAEQSSLLVQADVYFREPTFSQDLAPLYTEEDSESEE